MDITFRPVEVGASVLLQSESQRYIHKLMVSRVSKLHVYSFKQKLNDMVLKLNCSSVGFNHTTARWLRVFNIIISIIPQLLHPFSWDLPGTLPPILTQP